MKLIDLAKKLYHRANNSAFNDNWLKYVTSSWKRFLIFEALILIPPIGFSFLIAVSPRAKSFGLSKGIGVHPWFMRKATRQEAVKGSFIYLAWMMVNFFLGWLAILPIREAGLICCK